MPLVRHKPHLSVQKHRTQLWTQILLPVLLAAAVLIAVIVLTALDTVRGQGDVSRWAALSTIWLTLPLLLTGLLLLAVLIGSIYLLSRLLELIPPYSLLAQVLFYRVEAGAKRISTMIIRPAVFFEEIGWQIRKRLGRKSERSTHP